MVSPGRYASHQQGPRGPNTSRCGKGCNGSTTKKKKNRHCVLPAGDLTWSPRPFPRLSERRSFIGDANNRLCWSGGFFLSTDEYTGGISVPHKSQ
ncbi:hypothetical protein LX36DRAFT_372829 [Colletotrichum falcatum]|nr:hypothetical protein LX36DRAFT_372829 [Colletotrichum falcatum]